MTGQPGRPPGSTIEHLCPDCGRTVPPTIRRNIAGHYNLQTGAICKGSGKPYHLTHQAQP
jgi:hypothetical protein